jgi:hypothetical protein
MISAAVISRMRVSILSEVGIEIIIFRLYPARPLHADSIAKKKPPRKLIRGGSFGSLSGNG